MILDIRAIHNYDKSPPTQHTHDTQWHSPHAGNLPSAFMPCISANSLFVFSYLGEFFYSPHHCTAFSTLFCRTPSVSIETHLALVSRSLPAFVIALCWPPFLALLRCVFRCWNAPALEHWILNLFFSLFSRLFLFPMVLNSSYRPMALKVRTLAAPTLSS